MEDEEQSSTEVNLETQWKWLRRGKEGTERYSNSVAHRQDCLSAAGCLQEHGRSEGMIDNCHSSN